MLNLEKITVVLLDNDSRGLEALVYNVSMVPQLVVKKTFTDPYAADFWFRDNEADLLITDIDMPGLNGIDLMHSLVVKPLVIFCTGFSEYALPAFSVDAVDFLVKPINFNYFVNSIAKAARRLNKPILLEPKKKLDVIFVRDTYTKSIVRVVFSNIQYVEGDNKYVKIHCLDRVIRTRITLAEMVSELPHDDFMRVHDSFIISLDLMDRLAEGYVYLKDIEKGIPLGKVYGPNLRRYIVHNRIDFDKYGCDKDDCEKNDCEKDDSD